MNGTSSCAKEAGEYLIGDVAGMVGLSRDALRFYEKKGVIKAKRKENGYRCYSEDDIYRLMLISYNRKMNSSLEDIEGFLQGRISIHGMMEYLERRIEEEEREIRRHRQAIERLRMMNRDAQMVDRYYEKCSLKMFPSAYIVDVCPNLREGLKRWFELSAGQEGMDMNYFYDVMTWDGGTLCHRETQLLLYRKLKSVLPESFREDAYPLTSERECIYMVVESDGFEPTIAQVEQMVSWGQERELHPEGTLYANCIMGSICDALSMRGAHDAVNWLELYMPVRRSGRFNPTRPALPFPARS